MSEGRPFCPACDANYNACTCELGPATDEALAVERLARAQGADVTVERDGANCVCWKENDNVTPRANEAVCPKHRGNVDVPTAWEMLRLAAGYFHAIEEQLRPILGHPDTTEEFRLSAYGTAMETAANIAMHQRINIEREGIEAARIQASTLSCDMRGENALAWLAGTLEPKSAAPRAGDKGGGHSTEAGGGPGGPEREVK